MKPQPVKLMSLITKLPYFETTDRQILLVLCDHASTLSEDIAFAFPTQATIACRVGTSDRTVSRRLGVLEGLKLVRKSPVKSEKKQARKGYLLNLRLLTQLSCEYDAHIKRQRDLYGRGRAWVKPSNEFALRRKKELYRDGPALHLIPDEWFHSHSEWGEDEEAMT